MPVPPAIMTPNPASSHTSIFKGGKLKPGIYKIQSLCAETYLDIQLNTKQLCCRPAQNLGEGRGLVRLHLLFVVRVSDAQKWEIKPLGPGYMVRRVSLVT